MQRAEDVAADRTGRVAVAGMRHRQRQRSEELLGLEVGQGRIDPFKEFLAAAPDLSELGIDRSGDGPR
jgi:hypothetical protein